MDNGGERVGRGNKIGYVKRGIGKKRKQILRRVRRSDMTVSNTLQQLFHSCTEAFKGPDTVPSPQDVQRLRQILGMMLITTNSLLSIDLFFFRMLSCSGVCLNFDL